jgi:hypothetical protein
MRGGGLGKIKSDGGCFEKRVETRNWKNEMGGGGSPDGDPVLWPKYRFGKKYHNPKSPKRWKRLVLDFNSGVQIWENIPRC